jgi:leucyl/phenylalanyl-tRNA--protein transferase
MFSWRNDASKIALVHLAQSLPLWQCKVIDCQVNTEHLITMGAEEIPRSDFIKLLNQ